MSDEERQERQDIIRWLKECYLLFKIAYNE